jgi:hypothetical protein
LEESERQSLVQLDFVWVPALLECSVVVQNLVYHSKNVAGALGVVGGGVATASTPAAFERGAFTLKSRKQVVKNHSRWTITPVNDQSAMVKTATLVLIGLQLTEHDQCKM